MSHYPPTNPSEFETDDESLFIRPEIPPDMLIAVTLLKQYAYCPRIVYYETCTPRVRPTSSTMRSRRGSSGAAGGIGRRGGQ